MTKFEYEMFDNIHNTLQKPSKVTFTPSAYEHANPPLA